MPHHNNRLSPEIIAKAQARETAQRVAREHAGLVYFIGCYKTETRRNWSDVVAIKIGHTRKPLVSRLCSLAGSCPLPLVCLATVAGGIATERALHAALASSRRPAGEWFNPTIDIRAIVGLAAKTSSWTPVDIEAVARGLVAHPNEDMFG